MSESKKKQSEENTVKTGFCKFCQQGFQMEASETDTQEQLDQWATEKCGCSEAKEAAASRGSVDNAKQNIEKLFRNENPVLEDILKDALPYVQGGEITKITISAPAGIKGTVFKNSKDKIVVKHDKQSTINLES